MLNANSEVSTAILKNIQAFCDVGLTRHDISDLFLALKIEALCIMCKYYRLRRRNISLKTCLHRKLHHICAIGINREKDYLTVWNVLLKSYAYICFNIGDGVLTTRHVRMFILLWQGMVTLSPNKLCQILITMPVQCLSCETRYEFLNIS
jgi:hypothetical protein